MKQKILLLENIHQDAVTILVSAGYDVELYTHALNETELAEKIKGVTVLGIRSKTQVTKAVLDKAKKLQVIGTFCIGTDQVDLRECERRNIAVFNAPFSNTRSVVELVVGEMIMLSRQVIDKSNKLHGGEWQKSAKGSSEIRGKTLGIIGYGNIGPQLSVIAEALGMHVLFYDLAERLAFGNAKASLTMKDVLTKSDIISVHVDGRKENENLISEREFSLMKKGVLFLNASRGKVVDLIALAEYLKNGRVAGAAIDVFPEEPEKNGEAFTTPLQNLPHVILTPHIGGSTEEAQERIAHYMCRKIQAFLANGDVSLAVVAPRKEKK